jgi:hypothetical protein
MIEKTLIAKVKKWMSYHKNDYDNATSLAEAAAHHADGDNDEWLDDSDHWVWELAIEIIPPN